MKQSKYDTDRTASATHPSARTSCTSPATRTPWTEHGAGHRGGSLPKIGIKLTYA